MTSLGKQSTLISVFIPSRFILCHPCPFYTRTQNQTDTKNQGRGCYFRSCLFHGFDGLLASGVHRVKSKQLSSFPVGMEMKLKQLKKRKNRGILPACLRRKTSVWRNK